jgi:DNA polymerase III delta prime subunit
MIDKLLLHPKTRRNVSALLERTPHAILITGVQGSGKETLAKHLAAEMLAVNTESLAKQAYFLLINPASDSISIDDIRSLQQFLKLKAISNTQNINRVVLINNASRMRTEAQNALLKTLEEPPAGTVLILTADKDETLLPTIVSRVSTVTVLPVSQVDAESHFKRSIAKEYALSQGQVGLLHALLHEETHPLIGYVEMAKIILAEKPAQRLLRTDELAKDKEGIKMLLDALQRIAHSALYYASKQGKQESVINWHKRQEVIVKTNSQQLYNANTKLLLDNLFLHI